MNERIISIIKSIIKNRPDEEQMLLVETINGNTCFREELALTSLECMILICDIEKEYGISIDFFSFAKCTTIDDLSESLNSLVEKARQ